HAGELLPALILRRHREEGRDRIRAPRLKELADLRALAKVAVNIAEHGAHRALQRCLSRHGTVDDLAATGVIDGFEFVPGAGGTAHDCNADEENAELCEPADFKPGHATLLA